MSAPRLVVFTDLDGTFLDEKTYSYAESLSALRSVLSVPGAVVLCSSKTWSEMIALWEELRLHDPFVVENGGAVYIPDDYFPFALPEASGDGRFQKIELGTKIGVLRQVLKETSARLGVRIHSFEAMSVEEIAQRTGLSPEQAEAAAAREYDEPFVVEARDEAALVAALRDQGFEVVTGGRFLHLHGKHDKGKAVKLLLDYYRRLNPAIRSAGLGDSPNDISFLKLVDDPVLIRNRNGSWNPEVSAAIPAVQKTPEPGPRGWGKSIGRILKELGG